MGHGHYRNYIAFGVTSVFMLIGCALLLFGVSALGRGPEAWQAYLEALGSPPALLLTLIVLANTIYFALRFGWVGRKIAGARLMGIPVAPPAPLAVHGAMVCGGFVMVWLVVLLVLFGVLP
jgi:fumarate reductase subunit C